MKKGFRTLTTMLLSLFYLFSCSDKESENGGEAMSTNRLSIYGLVYPLEKGAIYHENDHLLMEVKPYQFIDRYRMEDGVEKEDTINGFTSSLQENRTGNFLVALYEGTFVISKELKQANGIGACICIRFASPETDRLVPGKYVFSTLPKEFTFIAYSSVKHSSYGGSSGWDEGLAGQTIPNTISEGEIEVVLEGDVYTIKFDCRTDNKGVVKGVYEGPVEAFNTKKEAEKPIDFMGYNLQAMYDTLKYEDESGNVIISPDVADIRAKSVFLSQEPSKYKTSPLAAVLLSSAEKMLTDIMLVYDRKKKTIKFISPIELRAWLGHSSVYNLPCHTKYMMAPSTFTNDHFEALLENDCTFPITEQEVELSETQTTPCFIFVETGTGARGVIRINKITPMSIVPVYSQYYNYPKNASIDIDFKLTQTLPSVKLR